MKVLVNKYHAKLHKVIHKRVLIVRGVNLCVEISKKTFHEYTFHILWFSSYEELRKMIKVSILWRDTRRTKFTRYKFYRNSKLNYVVRPIPNSMERLDDSWTGYNLRGTDFTYYRKMSRNVESNFFYSVLRSRENEFRRSWTRYRLDQRVSISEISLRFSIGFIHDTCLYVYLIIGKQYFWISPLRERIISLEFRKYSYANARYLLILSVKFIIELYKLIHFTKYTYKIFYKQLQQSYPA